MCASGPHDARALVDVVVRSVGLSRTQTTSRSITDLVLHFKKKTGDVSSDGDVV